MEEINSLETLATSPASSALSIGKKRKSGPKASVFISFFREGKCFECGYVPKDNLTASNVKRHLHNSHPHLPIFNEDPSKLLALYAATSSMSLCHIENPYLKELLSMIPGFQVPTRRTLARMIDRQCEVTMNNIREQVRKSSAKISIFADIATTKGMRRSYLGVAGHFFCDESKSMRVGALDMFEMEERHTGPAIAESLSNVLNEANLGKKPMRYVSDDQYEGRDPFLNCNVDLIEQEMELLLVDQADCVTLDTPYNYEADDDDQEEEQQVYPSFDFPFHTVCAAHSLQLVLKDVFEKDSEMISLRKRIFAIIGKFAKSHEAT